jgi:uncharacterized membrane protein YeaQ/YmgE (transglycosylase-associated protein family)
MRINVLPKTSLGRWSVGLTIALILFYVLAEVLYGFEVFGLGAQTTFGNVLGIVGACISGAVFVTGLTSLVKNKERSALVFVTTVIGAYSLFGFITGLLGLQK